MIMKGMLESLPLFELHELSPMLSKHSVLTVLELPVLELSVGMTVETPMSKMMGTMGQLVSPVSSSCSGSTPSDQCSHTRSMPCRFY